MNIEIESKVLTVGGQPQKNYEIIKEIGRGANGIVYLGKNKIINRNEAVKIWYNKKENDSRDKRKQALLEIEKLARVNNENAVTLYYAEELNGHIVACMEYFKGETLKDFIIDKTPNQICTILRHYLVAIEETSKFETFHGDAHEKNVLVQLVIDKYETLTKLKLCDFGTSVFSGKENSFNRHWKIVRQTICKSTKGMKNYDYAQELLTDFEKIISNTIVEMTEKVMSGDNSLYDPRIFTAVFKDYLEYLESVNENFA